MGRSEGLSPREPQPPSRKLFPVGRTAIDTAQCFITPSSRATTTDMEIDYINKNNDEFFSVLKKFFGRYTERINNNELKFYMHPFMDGAMFVHFAFRLQAEDQLPVFLVEGKRNDVEDIFQKEIDDISKFARDRDIDEQELEIIAQVRISILANTNNDDSLLGQAIIAQSETFNDTRDGDTFLVGAMFAYDAIKSRYQDIEQEKEEFERRKIKDETDRIATEEADAELKSWSDPELDEFEVFSRNLLPIENGTGRQSATAEVDIDTSDLGIDFDAGIAELEEFLNQQGGQQDAA